MSNTRLGTPKTVDITSGLARYAERLGTPASAANTSDANRAAPMLEKVLLIKTEAALVPKILANKPPVEGGISTVPTFHITPFDAIIGSSATTIPCVLDPVRSVPFSGEPSVPSASGLSRLTMIDSPLTVAILAPGTISLTTVPAP